MNFCLAGTYRDPGPLEQDIWPIEDTEVTARSHQIRCPYLRTYDPVLALDQLVYVRSHAGPAKGRRCPDWSQPGKDP